MNGLSNKIQGFINDVAASVAIIARDDAGKPIIIACNERFFQMLGGLPAFERNFPMSLDAIVPDYARREFHEKANECFDTGVAQELEQAYDRRNETRWWRLSNVNRVFYFSVSNL